MKIKLWVIFYLASGLPNIDFSSIQLPGISGRQQQLSSEPDPETIRSMFLADPHQLALLKERNPTLAEALNDPGKGKTSSGLCKKYLH